MTREETIKYLKKMKDECNDTFHKVRYVTREEAIEMAIKALEQEPCEDAISREELLKAIDTWDRFGVDDTNSLFRLDNLSLPHYVPYIHYDDVIKCIKGMPSVNPQEPKAGHWIDHQEGRWIYAKCSECGEIHDTASNYCPSCGCLMDKNDFNAYIKAESEDT